MTKCPECEAELKIVEAVELGIGGIAAPGTQAVDGDDADAAGDVGEGRARQRHAVQQVIDAIEPAAGEPELHAIEE